MGEAEAEVPAEVPEALVASLTERETRAAELFKAGAGEADYRAYLNELQVCAAVKNRSKWASALSRGARGKLSGHWSTPRSVLDEVAEVARLSGLGLGVGLDIAADPGSAVADSWFGPFHMDPRRRDALAPEVSWRIQVDARRPGLLLPSYAWLNSPYDNISAFMVKAATEYPKNYSGSLLSLSFARIDTKWFHRALDSDTVSSIWARKGRVAFVDPTTGKKGMTAPAPSMLMTFGRSLSRDAPPDRVGPWTRLYLRDAEF